MLVYGRALDSDLIYILKSFQLSEYDSRAHKLIKKIQNYPKILRDENEQVICIIVKNIMICEPGSLESIFRDVDLSDCDGSLETAYSIVDELSKAALICKRWHAIEIFEKNIFSFFESLLRIVAYMFLYASFFGAIAFAASFLESGNAKESEAIKHADYWDFLDYRDSHQTIGFERSTKTLRTSCHGTFSEDCVNSIAWRAVKIYTNSGTGSGYIYKSSYGKTFIITAAHVVEEADGRIKYPDVHWNNWELSNHMDLSASAVCSFSGTGWNNRDFAIIEIPGSLPAGVKINEPFIETGLADDERLYSPTHRSVVLHPMQVTVFSAQLNIDDLIGLKMFRLKSSFANYFSFFLDRSFEMSGMSGSALFDKNGSIIGVLTHGNDLIGLAAKIPKEVEGIRDLSEIADLQNVNCASFRN